jgi:hypothetical protein
MPYHSAGSNPAPSGAFADLDLGKTGSDIDFGSGLVVSKTLSRGRITRKCMKYQAVAIRDNTT